MNKKCPLAKIRCILVKFVQFHSVRLNCYPTTKYDHSVAIWCSASRNFKRNHTQIFISFYILSNFIGFFFLTKWSLLWIFDETSFCSYFNSKRLSNSEISYIWKVHLYMDFFLKLIVFVGTYRSMSCSWSYGSWIYNYLCNQCLSSLTLWVRIPSLRGVLDTTSCDKVRQWPTTGRWFSPDTQVSPINKIDRYDITEILLKVVLNTTSITLCVDVFSLFITVYKRNSAERSQRVSFCIE